MLSLLESTRSASEFEQLMKISDDENLSTRLIDELRIHPEKSSHSGIEIQDVACL